MECPGWYVPNAMVADYEPLAPNVVSVYVDRWSLDQIAADLTSLYVCDSARYQDSKTGAWTFVEVEPSDLLYRLGIRSGDGTAAVQGVEPATQAPLTPAHRLDSIDAMLQAYTELWGAEGVLLSVEREDAPGGTFEIWITIDR